MTDARTDKHYWAARQEKPKRGRRVRHDQRQTRWPFTLWGMSFCGHRKGRFAGAAWAPKRIHWPGKHPYRCVIGKGAWT